jgi:hypothetical protein
LSTFGCGAGAFGRATDGTGKLSASVRTALSESASHKALNSAPEGKLSPELHLVQGSAGETASNKTQMDIQIAVSFPRVWMERLKPGLSPPQGSGGGNQESCKIGPYSGCGGCRFLNGEDMAFLGAGGSSAYWTLTELLPIVIDAPADRKTRDRWLERLYLAIQEDGVDYLDRVKDDRGP